MNNAKLFSCAITLVTPDIKNAAKYYNEVLGFKVIEHYDHEEKFAACYRDSVEIVLVQAKKGTVQSNRDRYGAGYDAYLVPEDVDAFYEELKQKGARIIEPLAITDYGSYEFTIEDVDGRIVGIGRVADRERFFEN